MIIKCPACGNETILIKDGVLVFGATEVKTDYYYCEECKAEILDQKQIQPEQPGCIFFMQPIPYIPFSFLDHISHNKL